MKLPEYVSVEEVKKIYLALKLKRLKRKMLKLAPKCQHLVLHYFSCVSENGRQTQIIMDKPRREMNFMYSK